MTVDVDLGAVRAAVARQAARVTEGTEDMERHLAAVAELITEVSRAVPPVMR